MRSLCVPVMVGLLLSTFALGQEGRKRTPAPLSATEDDALRSRGAETPLLQHFEGGASPWIGLLFVPGIFIVTFAVLAIAMLFGWTPGIFAVVRRGR